MDDSGPAFPCSNCWNSYGTSIGMTLREWYAGMALQGILAQGGQWEKQWGDSRAKEAYSIADAMIAKGREGR